MGALGYCKICNGEICTRGDVLACISCGLPVHPRQPVKVDDPKRAAAIEASRAKAKAQRVALEAAIAARTAEKQSVPVPVTPPVPAPEVVIVPPVAEPVAEAVAEPAKAAKKKK